LADGKDPSVEYVSREQHFHLYLTVEDVDSFASRLVEHGVDLMQAPHDTPWAADILGDAHALDTGRAVATLILSAWRHPSTGGKIEVVEYFICRQFRFSKMAFDSPPVALGDFMFDQGHQQACGGPAFLVGALSKLRP
jgi:hypothetical protein